MLGCVARGLMRLGHFSVGLVICILDDDYRAGFPGWPKSGTAAQQGIVPKNPGLNTLAGICPLLSPARRNIMENSVSLYDPIVSANAHARVSCSF